jgi:threonine/homoserine/homoserine lactone efflux protein
MLVSNLALVFGTLAESVELYLAVAMMLGGIYLTYLVQKWADRSGEHAAAANIGLSGHPEQREHPSMRD